MKTENKRLQERVKKLLAAKIGEEEPRSESRTKIKFNKSYDKNHNPTFSTDFSPQSKKSKGPFSKFNTEKSIYK